MVIEPYIKQYNAEFVQAPPHHVHTIVQKGKKGNSSTQKENQPVVPIPKNEKEIAL
jgi:hypothetical protein